MQKKIYRRMSYICTLKYYRLDILRYITKLEITKIMRLRKTADSFLSSLRYFINTKLNIFIMSLVKKYNPSERVWQNIHRIQYWNSGNIFISWRSCFHYFFQLKSHFLNQNIFNLINVIGQYHHNKINLPEIYSRFSIFL